MTKSVIRAEGWPQTVRLWNERWPCTKHQANTTSSAALPNKVQKNISTLASTTRSDFEVKRNRNKEVNRRSSKPTKSTGSESVVTKAKAMAAKATDENTAFRNIVMGFAASKIKKTPLVSAPLSKTAVWKEKSSGQSAAQSARRV